MITAWLGRRGVYFTASAVEEMMSVNGQNVETGTHQEKGGSVRLFKVAHETPLSHYLQPRCLLRVRFLWPLTPKMPGCCKRFKTQLIWKRGRPRSRRTFKGGTRSPGLVHWCRASSTVGPLLCHPFRTAAGGEEPLSPPVWLGAQRLLTTTVLQVIALYYYPCGALMNIKTPLDKAAHFDV